MENLKTCKLLNIDPYRPVVSAISGFQFMKFCPLVAKIKNKNYS